MTQRTLGARLADLDAERFVGRERELRLVDSILVDAGQPRVLLIHGPGGIGKSALVREIARRAEARGYTGYRIEGRELPPVPDALEDVLVGVREERRPLLILDSYERITAIGGYLRRAVLPSLPGEALVVIAARGSPEEAWFGGGWEAVTTELELGALPEVEALEVLRSRGIRAEAIAREVFRWAGGSPLALSLAAEAARADSDWEPGRGLERPELIGALIRRLTEDEANGPHFAALGAASIARVTTLALLRAALPGVDAQAEFDWLSSRTFVEPLGEGIALHELVRKAVRADLRRRDPDLERELRLRIADHLYERATRTGDLPVSIDLSHLAESPAIRWGYSWEASDRFRIDDPQPGDERLVGERLGRTRHRAFWEGARRFFAEAPQHVAVVRDSDDRVWGYTIAMTPRTAPGFAAEDAVLGPRLAHAREHHPGEDTLLLREIVDFSSHPGSGVIAMLGLAGTLRPARGNPRWTYLPINPRFPGALEFSAALGAEHLEGLDVTLGGETIECHLLDHGLGGVLTAQRDLVYRELGLEPPPPAAGPRIGVDTVRDALRNLDLPHELASSPLASGEGLDQRAASVRALLDEAAERAFADNPGERLTRDVLVRGYLDPAPSHELAADELSLSRSAYFRRLRRATERVADYLSQRGR